jgi:hypothetical protein
VLTIITDAKVCTRAELLGEVGAADPMLLLAGLARRSAILEQTGHDGALENRLAVAVLANAVLHAPSPARRVDGVGANYPRLLRRANGVTGARAEVVLTGRTLTEQNCRNVLRMYAQHEALLGPLKPGLARTQMLLGRVLPDVLRDRPNPLDALVGATGLPFPELRALFFVLYAWALQLDERALPRIVPRLFAATRNAEASFRALLPFAKSMADLKTLSTTSKTYRDGPRDDFRYAYSALRDYPLVLLSPDLAIAPVARYLALVFSDGIFDFLREHMKSGAKGMAAFDPVFGAVAEAYVRRRVDHELGAAHYRPLRPIKGDLSPDGVIGDDCVVEIKGKRLLRGILTTGDLLTGAHYLGKDGLGHGIAQLLSEISRTRSGRGRGLRGDRLDDVVPCLVTPDGLPGFHLEPIRCSVTTAFADVIRRDFPALGSEVPALERFEWLSFDDVDRVAMAARAGNTSFGRLLRRYRLEAPAPFDAKTGKFAPTIRTWTTNRHPELVNDAWLNDAFEEAAQDWTGRLFDEAP